MKLNLKKKAIKSLSDSGNTIDYAKTPAIAGGVDINQMIKDAYPGVGSAPHNGCIMYVTTGCPRPITSKCNLITHWP
ncbi:hypothetical protein L1077_15660 [Pseudoalteromonas luteoviolacea]|uniref:hypothetical protein n=1 Tax=Pseudoalteromonas luteoviolacea TaxID=43657 RepID=UPI001F1F53DA|nr:hypothetical protein [Pseudoalteromonas luteoviolacea]MCF6440874.1 hypothetical protein [Pseudoalteromonas luteoviolacea]